MNHTYLLVDMFIFISICEEPVTISLGFHFWGWHFLFGLLSIGRSNLCLPIVPWLSCSCQNPNLPFLHPFMNHIASECQVQPRVLPRKTEDLLSFRYFSPPPPAPHPTWWVPLGKERKPAKAGSIPFFKHLPNSSGKYTLVTCDSITLTKNRIRSLLFMITKYYRIPFFFFFDLFGWKKDLDPSPPVKQPPQGPEWPSPHDCTSSVSDELVLIQLLNLVQLQRLSHTSFFACPLRVNFLFTHKPILLTQLPCSKQYSHLPCSSTHVKGFFPQNSLSFLFSLSVLLKIERTWP
jgi:hypothetical protein